MSYDPVQAMRQHARSTADEYRRTVVEGQYSFFRITQEPLWCRLIAGQYEIATYENGRQKLSKQPFFLFWEHYLAPKGDLGHQFLACKRNGNEYRPVEECPICQFLPDNDPRPVYAATLFGLGWYHMIQEPSRRNPNRLITYQEPCQRTESNPNCEYCRKGAPVVAGKLGHAKLGGRRDFNSIMQAAAEVGTHCQCGGTIYAHQLSCPRCHTILHSIDNDGLSDKEFRSYAQETYCRTCAVQVTPVADERCNRCRDPRPFNIFQADLLLSYSQDGSSRGPLQVEVSGMGDLPPEYNINAIKALDLQAIYAPKDRSVLMKVIRKYPGTFAPAVDPSGGQMRAPETQLGARTRSLPSLFRPDRQTTEKTPELTPPRRPLGGLIPPARLGGSVPRAPLGDSQPLVDIERVTKQPQPQSEPDDFPPRLLETPRAQSAPPNLAGTYEEVEDEDAD